MMKNEKDDENEENEENERGKMKICKEEATK